LNTAKTWKASSCGKPPVLETTTLKQHLSELTVTRKTRKEGTPVTTIITSLPHATNDGRATGYERALFFAKLHTDGVQYTVETPCYGIWFGDDGACYAEETTLVWAQGSEHAIRQAVAAFGEAAGQLEMLFVEEQEDGSHVVTAQTGATHERGRAIAKQLAALHGGTTLLPNYTALVLNYASLVAGKDYSDAFVTR
jgi:hypothetical protein